MVKIEEDRLSLTLTDLVVMFLVLALLALLVIPRVVERTKEGEVRAQKQEAPRYKIEPIPGSNSAYLVTAYSCDPNGCYASCLDQAVNELELEGHKAEFITPCFYMPVGRQLQMVWVRTKKK